MGKLMNNLNAQLKTEHREDAEKCIVIYEHLKDIGGGYVWESNWKPLVSTSFEGSFPNSVRVCKPTNLGLSLLKSLKSESAEDIEQTHNKIREILIRYNNPEFGDCIVDEICFLFGYPTTTDINPEED
jgi:hypothetical protein